LCNFDPGKLTRSRLTAPGFASGFSEKFTGEPELAGGPNIVVRLGQGGSDPRPRLDGTGNPDRRGRGGQARTTTRAAPNFLDPMLGGLITSGRGARRR
jgi:hypothetical protein